MELEIAHKLSPEGVAVIIAVVIFLMKTVWEIVSGKVNKSETRMEENTQAVRELNLNIRHMTDRLVIIENTMEKHSDALTVVWELKKDMGYAFEKIRDLEQRP